eukprot:scaffold273_cov242-Pinguiococcus_pyrenoidosus.AAC.48
MVWPSCAGLAREMSEPVLETPQQRKRWEASTRGRYQGKPIQKGAGDDLGLSAVGNGTTYAVVGILLLWDSRDGGLLPLPEEDEDRTNVVDQVRAPLGRVGRRVLRGRLLLTELVG